METVNLEIKRGDSKSWTLYFKNEDGSAINISGFTIYFTTKSKLEDSDDDAIIKKDITEHQDAANGITKLMLTPDDTAQTPGNYIFDLQIKSNLAEITTILEGTLTILQDITQRS